MAPLKTLDHFRGISLFFGYSAGVFLLFHLFFHRLETKAESVILAGLDSKTE